MMTAKVNPAPASEVRLALLLCRFPVPAGELAALKLEASRICGEVSDWPAFLSLVQRHRIVPLVARNAVTLQTPLPSLVVEELKAHSSQNAIECFRYLAEVGRLLKVLADAGVPAIVIKGAALSQQAYGDFSTRDVGDIDLLIGAEDTERVDRLLQAPETAGKSLRRTEPMGILTARRFAAYVTSFKDFTYQPCRDSAVGAVNDFEIDLHWRLFRNPSMPGNGLQAYARVCVSASSVSLPTFSRSTNLLYLAVHGTVDGWRRLKAVADVAALWNGMSDAERDQSVNMARESAVLPYLSAALLLAQQWIGGLVAPRPAMSRAQTRLVAGIVRKARQTMESAHFLPPLREDSSWRMKQYEASLHGSVSYRWAIVRRILYRPRVWSRFDLPDRWFFLYPLLSPVEWLLFHTRRAFLSPGGRT